MIELIIFDLFGVLIKTKKLSINEEINGNFFKPYLNNISETPKLVKANKIDNKSFHQYLKKAYSTKFKISTKDFTTKYFKPTFDQSIIELINKLKNNNFKVCCATNIKKEYSYIIKTLEEMKLFDTIYPSYKFNFDKSDREYFQYILSNENTKAKNTLFIDDNASNTYLASSLNINTILYFNTPKLKKEIQKFIL